MKFRWIIEWRGLKIPTVGIIIFGISLFFSAGMIIAPLTLPPDSITDLTGKVGTVENEDITEDMNPYAKFFYDSGDSNCHTISERSLFINGNQMPFCARDVAIFFGMTLGLLFALFIRVPLKWWWLIGGLVPIGIDGTVQLLTPYESTNLMRLLTGGLAGIVTSLALGWVIFDVSQVAGMRHEVSPEGDMDGWPIDDILDNREDAAELPQEPKELPLTEAAPPDDVYGNDEPLAVKEKKAGDI